MAGGRLEDYVDVAARLQKFHEKYEDGSVTSEILVDDGKRIVLKATAQAYAGDFLKIGTGHAEEIRGSSHINRTSALENCETSAWGRALAAFGLEVKNGVASKQEVEKAKANEVRQAQEKTLTVKQAASVADKLDGVDAARIELALAAVGKPSIAELTVPEAKKLVELATKFEEVS